MSRIKKESLSLPGHRTIPYSDTLGYRLVRHFFVLFCFFVFFLFLFCSSGSLLQSALHDLRKLLLQNGYPQGIINYHINDVLNKNRNQHSNPVSTVPKKDIIILLPYLRSQSNQVAKRLKSCVYKFYSCVNLKIVFRALNA